MGGVDLPESGVISLNLFHLRIRLGCTDQPVMQSMQYLRSYLPVEADAFGFTSRFECDTTKKTAARTLTGRLSYLPVGGSESEGIGNAEEYLTTGVAEHPLRAPLLTRPLVPHLIGQVQRIEIDGEL